jgi:hypothetical protein
MDGDGGCASRGCARGASRHCHGRGSVGERGRRRRSRSGRSRPCGHRGSRGCRRSFDRGRSPGRAEGPSDAREREERGAQGGEPERCLRLGQRRGEGMDGVGHGSRRLTTRGTEVSSGGSGRPPAGKRAPAGVAYRRRETSGLASLAARTRYPLARATPNSLHGLPRRPRRWRPLGRRRSGSARSSPRHRSPCRRDGEASGRGQRGRAIEPRRRHHRA